MAGTLELENEARDKMQQRMGGFGIPQIAVNVDVAGQAFELELGGEADANEADEEPEEADGEQADEIEMAQMMPAMEMIMSGFGSHPISGASPETTGIRESAVEKTLTDDQHLLRKEHLAGRELFQRQTLVNSFVMGVDRELCLSADQRQRLTETIDKQFGDQLLRNGTANGQQGIDQFFNGVVQPGGGPVNEGADDDFAAFKSEVHEILDESRIPVWEQSFAAS